MRSDIGWSTADRITIRGLDLPNEILGHFNLGDFAYFNLTGQRPSAQQSVVFNAIVVTLVEHGLTPSALVARLTYAGAPESLQAAVAAGLCGLGTVFVGTMEGATKLLYNALPKDAATPENLSAVAREVVARFRAERRAIPGIGHPIHKPIDPRTPRLFKIAGENGMAGRYVALMQCVQQEAERASGKVLPLNATGAIGAICCEFGFAAEIIRGFGVMARAIGLVSHLAEEARNPLALEAWRRTEDEASSHLRSA